MIAIKNTVIVIPQQISGCFGEKKRRKKTREHVHTASTCCSRAAERVSLRMGASSVWENPVSWVNSSDQGWPITQPAAARQADASVLGFSHPYQSWRIIFKGVKYSNHFWDYFIDVSQPRIVIFFIFNTWTEFGELLATRLKTIHKFHFTDQTYWEGRYFDSFKIYIMSWYWTNISRGLGIRVHVSSNILEVVNYDEIK